jgi:hypothetical protein
MSTDTFSKRHGYDSGAPPISVREDAPAFFRFALAGLFWEVQLSSGDARRIVCHVLRRVPIRDNWSDGNISDEVESLISDCDWWKVYDVIEAIWKELSTGTDSIHVDPGPPPKYERVGIVFARRVNELLVESGIGWQLQQGKIQLRGDGAFERSVKGAALALAGAGRQTAQNELSEALRDLSRRPEPDVSGAVQHGLAALECFARDLTGEPKLTLGQLAKHQAIPKPLDQLIEKAWGYSSERGRHLREGNAPDHREAELMIALSAAIINYLSEGTAEATAVEVPLAAPESDDDIPF